MSDPYSRFATGDVDVDFRHTFRAQSEDGTAFPDVVVDMDGLTFVALDEAATRALRRSSNRRLAVPLVGIALLCWVVLFLGAVPAWFAPFSTLFSAFVMVVLVVRGHSAPLRVWWRLHASPRGVILDRLTGPVPDRRRMLDRMPQDHALDRHPAEGVIPWNAMDRLVFERGRMVVGPATLPPLDAPSATIRHVVAELQAARAAYATADREPTQADRAAMAGVKRLLDS
jgi:hypothetical protein